MKKSFWEQFHPGKKEGASHFLFASGILNSHACSSPQLTRKWFLSGQEPSLSSHVPDSILIRTEDNFLVSAMHVGCKWLASAPCSDGAIPIGQLVRVISTDLRATQGESRCSSAVSNLQDTRKWALRAVYFKITWGTTETGKRQTREFQLSQTLKVKLKHSRNSVTGLG